MSDFSNTSWVEQSTGLTIVIGPVQIDTRSCVTSVGPTTLADVDFRVYHVEGVEGSALFAGTAAYDESGLDGYVAKGLLLASP